MLSIFNAEPDINLFEVYRDWFPKSIHQRCQYKTISAFGCFMVQSFAPARTLFALNVAQKDEDDDDDEEEKKSSKSDQENMLNDKKRERQWNK